MARYIHKMTGSIDDKDGWIASYTIEELEHRGVTAEQAFTKDVGVTLFELADESPAATLGRKGGSSKSDAKRRASAENGKKGGRPKKVK